MYKNAKILLYFQQYYVIRLGEKIYHYNPRLDVFPLFQAFITLLLHAIKNVSSFSVDKNLKKTYKELVFIETINQKNALIDIFLSKKNKEETYFLLNDINEKLHFPQYDQSDFPKKQAFFKALFCLFKAYLISKKYRRSQKGKVNSVHILINLSLFISCSKIFEKELTQRNIQQVVLTNDHNLHPLALLHASRNLNIRTYYIQHASVSPAFPKLLPEVSLLEGQQALDTYNLIGNSSRKIHLVGIPRLDGILAYNQFLNKTDITIGFCLKPYYSDELIKSYVEAISSLDNVSRIILRPHPGNGEKFYEKLQSYPVEISNARKERPHEFLKKLDVMISGESSIILESALMKVKTIYIDDEIAQYDLYGFVKNGIATPISSFEELEKELQNIDFEQVEAQYQNCKYYCSTVNTSFENKSKELILNILDDDKQNY